MDKTKSIKYVYNIQQIGSYIYLIVSKENPSIQYIIQYKLLRAIYHQPITPTKNINQQRFVSSKFATI